MSRIATQAFVTLATTDNYAVGALTLAQSLRAVGTQRSLAIMVTRDLSESMRSAVNDVFDHVEQIDVLDSNDTTNLQLLNRPELGVTFTKLHCWRLTQYTKCVFLDADCLVLRPVDDLFEERDEFSAAADVGWPDCFNSGVFVYRPSIATYEALLQFALSTGSFDGGDQGLLNLFFHDWSVSADASRRLPFLYNMTTNASYSYAPAFKRFADQIKIVHFIGARKPWFYTFNTLTGRVSGNVQQYEMTFVNQWWKIFSERVYERLGSDFKDKLRTQYVQASSSGSQASGQQGQSGAQRSQHEINFDQAWSNQQGSNQGDNHQGNSGGVVLGSSQHQSLWEQGQIDYTGRDSFANIQAHLDEQLRK